MIGTQAIPTTKIVIQSKEEESQLGPSHLGKTWTSGQRSVQKGIRLCMQIEYDKIKPDKQS